MTERKMAPKKGATESLLSTLRVAFRRHIIGEDLCPVFFGHGIRQTLLETYVDRESVG